MLSNFQIPEIFRAYSTPLIFIGMKDQMPKRVKDGNYIINLQSSTDGNGLHWLALRISGKEAFYADSFGAPPPIEIIAFVKRRKGVRFGYSNVIIQNLGSENCGYFASAFLIYLERNKTQSLFNTAKVYLRKFDANSALNDGVLREIYKSFSSATPALIRRLDDEKQIKYEN